MGGATDAMLQARYGYSRGRGPRRMPVRMTTTLPHGVDGEGASFGGLSDAVADEMFGVDIPDDVFATEMATIGRGVGAIGSSLQNLRKAGLQSVIPTAGRSAYQGLPDAVANEMFGVDVPDRLVNELSKYATTAQQDPLAAPTTAPAGQRYQRKPPVLQNMPPFFGGDIGDQAVAELFGADDEDLDDDDGDDEDGTEGKGGFSLKSLPGWAVPAAIGTAAAAGAVGLGLALTSKKRKAKRAAKEAEQFGAFGDQVSLQMFGDPDEDDDIIEADDAFGEDDEDDAFGDDPTAAVIQFGPGPSSDPSLQALIAPPPAQISGRAPSSPAWRQVKRATHDAYRAQKRLDRAQQNYSEAQAKVPQLGAPAPAFPAYGAYVPQFGAYLPQFGGLLPDTSALHAFMASLPRLSASDLYNKTVEFVLTYLGKMKAFANQSKFTAQYERFRTAVKSEGGFGPQAQSVANQGVDLVQQVSGEPVSAIDRQAMIAIARAQAPLILKGIG